MPKACLAKGLALLPHAFCCHRSTCLYRLRVHLLLVLLRTEPQGISQPFVNRSGLAATHLPALINPARPARGIVLMTQPQLLDPSWLAPGQLRMGSSRVQVGLQKVTETQPGQAALLSPCPRPGFPQGLSSPRKKIHLTVFNQSFTILMSPRLSVLHIYTSGCTLLSLYSLCQFV